MLHRREARCRPSQPPGLVQTFLSSARQACEQRTPATSAGAPSSSATASAPSSTVAAALRISPAQQGLSIQPKGVGPHAAVAEILRQLGRLDREAFGGDNVAPEQRDPSQLGQQQWARGQIADGRRDSEGVTVGVLRRLIVPEPEANLGGRAEQPTGAVDRLPFVERGR